MRTTTVTYGRIVRWVIKWDKVRPPVSTASGVVHPSFFAIMTLVWSVVTPGALPGMWAGGMVNILRILAPSIVVVAPPGAP